MSTVEQRLKQLETTLEILLESKDCCQEVCPPGPRGKDGIDGQKGKDGVNGRDGRDGVNGTNGQDGKTPVKGVDYFDGEDGEDGVSQASITVNAFYRTDEDIIPARPIGGTYLSPTPTTEGWSMTPPSGDGSLFISSRIFSDNATLPQTPQWTIPTLLSTDTILDLQWSIVEENPGTPTTIPENWSNANDENTKWLALRILNNSTWSDWSIVLVKGKDGIDGYTPIKGVDYFDGEDGVGISNTSYNPTTGVLTLYFTNSQEYSTGNLKGQDGTNGQDGSNGRGIVTIEVLGNPNQATITYTDSTTSTIALPSGPPGYTPIKNVDYFDGTNGIDGQDAQWVVMTQIDYDALPVKDPNVLYLISTT